jgi:ABC-type glycerol-3-phosphate transport system substrate-binding protein
MTRQNSLSRRDLIKVAGATSGAAAFGATPLLRSGKASAQDKKYAGVTLRGLTAGGGAYNPALLKMATEFEEQTGAKVEWDEQPWEQLMPKIQADLTAGSPTYDIFCNDIEFQYTIYPYLAPINDLIASTGYSMDGFFDPIHKYGEGIAGQEGVRYGLPISIGTSWVFYRTDLIAEFPTTWADYEAALGANTANGKYGLTFAGVTAQLIKLFLARYWSQGVALLTPDWKPNINGPEGVAALQRLYDNMKNFAPPGILAWDNPEASNAFLAGDAAVLEGWSAFVKPKLDDAAASQVVGKWDVAKYPENGSGNLTQHNMVIFNTSKNIPAAFDYIAYVTGPDNAKRLMLEYQVESPRQSVWSDPEVTAAQPYLTAVIEQYNVARPFTPGLPQWLELFIGLGEGLSAAMSDQKSPQDALNDVASKWEDLIKQAPPSFDYAE